MHAPHAGGGDVGDFLQVESLTDIRYYQDLAQRAQAALFDSIFLADQLALGGDAAQAPRTWLEPITILRRAPGCCRTTGVTHPTTNEVGQRVRVAIEHAVGGTGNDFRPSSWQ